MKSVWVVTAVDYGETCDYKARVLEICKTREEAEKYVREDMDHYVTDASRDDFHVDYGWMSASLKNNPDSGCEWNIEEVDLPDWIFDTNNGENK